MTAAPAALTVCTISKLFSCVSRRVARGLVSVGAQRTTPSASRPPLCGRGIFHVLKVFERGAGKTFFKK
ncbi:MAG: hypothetical protein LBL66_06570, partial [Clostridiales bacterium]|nr:hypothetical protein [Clostridiales bacterium]